VFVVFDTMAAGGNIGESCDLVASNLSVGDAQPFGFVVAPHPFLETGPTAEAAAVGVKNVKMTVVAGRPVVECSGCNKQGNDMLRCANCKKAYYCSRECQITDWKLKHKTVCQQPVPEEEEEEEEEDDEEEAEMEVEKPKHMCQHCGAEAEHMLLCVCKEARYCNKICQRADWKKRHKQTCKQVEFKMFSSRQIVSIAKALLPASDRAACDLYASQSKLTIMFCAATGQLRPDLLRPKERRDPRGSSKTIEEYIDDRDWGGWLEKDPTPFKTIKNMQLEVRTTCQLRKDWRGFFGVAIAEFAMSHCEIWNKTLKSAASRSGKALKFMTKVLATDEYRHNIMTEAEKFDVDNTNSNMLHTDTIIAASILEAANKISFKSLVQDATDVVGYAAALQHIIVMKAFIAKLVEEESLWSKLGMFANAFRCMGFVCTAYITMAFVKQDGKSGDAEFQVFDVKQEMQPHLNKARILQEKAGCDGPGADVMVNHFFNIHRYKKLPMPTEATLAALAKQE